MKTGNPMKPARFAAAGAVALLSVPVAWGQNQGAVTREGRYWVQTVEGTLEAAPGGRLRVSSVGRILVRGEAGNQLRYVAKKRLRAGSEAEAKRLLERAQVRATRHGPTVLVEVEQPHCGSCGFAVDLQITAPRSTDETTLETHGGSLEIYDLDGKASAQTAGGSIQMDRIGRSVNAQTAGGTITLGTIGGSVRCETAGGAIKLGTAHGDAVLTTNGGGIDAEQVDGKLRAETAGGSIRASRVSQGVTAETAGGSIHLGQIGGTVSAETAGGSITVEAAKGGVRAENASGSIKLLDVSGTLRAVTAAGNILAQIMAGEPLGESLLETSAGNITVVIPANARLTVRANVEVAGNMNRIQCDFPGFDIRMEDGRGPRSLTAEGAINGGGPVLRIHNTRGSIQIKRR